MTRPFNGMECRVTPWDKWFRYVNESFDLWFTFKACWSVVFPQLSFSVPFIQWMLEFVEDQIHLFFFPLFGFNGNRESSLKVKKKERKNSQQQTSTHKQLILTWTIIWVQNRCVFIWRSLCGSEVPKFFYRFSCEMWALVGWKDCRQPTNWMHAHGFVFRTQRISGKLDLLVSIAYAI